MLSIDILTVCGFQYNVCQMHSRQYNKFWKETDVNILSLFKYIVKFQKIPLFIYKKTKTGEICKYWFLLF